ncbi:hypothetical protein DYM07_09330 [Escherichia coli]|nr:hypothetical protein [Escherichia coli]
MGWIKGELLYIRFSDIDCKKVAILDMGKETLFIFNSGRFIHEYTFPANFILIEPIICPDADLFLVFVCKQKSGFQMFVK